MSDKNIVLLTFEDQSHAYQALSELKLAAAENRLQLRSAAVVECTGQGQVRARDAASDGSLAEPQLAGSLLGSIIGILGGPLGVLFGATSGAMLGSLVSVEQLENRSSLLEQMLHALPSGCTAVIAEVGEYAQEVLDKIAEKLDGVVLRRPVAAVQAEVDVIQDAQRAAIREARRVLREQQREEWREKFDDWKEEVGEKIDRLTDRIRKKLDLDKK